MRILVVDDHEIVRSGLQSLLHGKNGIEIIGGAADGDEAILLTQKLHPDLVLMDLSMPHGKDGLTATKELKQQFPHIAVLILTMHDQDEYLFRAIQVGASGYVLKSAPHEELQKAIESVALGHAYLSPHATQKVIKEFLDPVRRGETSSTYETLTDREVEIVEFVAKGYSNKEIAEKLIISVKTVETHKSRVMEKLKLQTRSELVEYAMKKGLLTFE